MIYTIYNCIDSLRNKMVTSTLVDHMDFRTILNNIQSKVIAKYLSLPSDPNTDIGSFFEFLKVNLLIFTDTLIIFIIVPLVNKTFHLHLYQIHSVPVVNIMLLKNPTYTSQELILSFN